MSQWINKSDFPCFEEGNDKLKKSLNVVRYGGRPGNELNCVLQKYRIMNTESWHCYNLVFILILGLLQTIATC